MRGKRPYRLRQCHGHNIDSAIAWLERLLKGVVLCLPTSLFTVSKGNAGDVVFNVQESRFLRFGDI